MTGNSMGRLEDKVGIVTGSTSGIGRATAICLAREGAKVVVTGRNEERGRMTVDRIHQAGGEATFVQQDITDEGDWQTLIARTTEAFGGTDILINNAGDCILKPIEDIETELFLFHLRVNIGSCFLGMKYAMPEMWRPFELPGEPPQRVSALSVTRRVGWGDCADSACRANEARRA